MKLLMISGDRGVVSGKRGAFWNTLELLSESFERIDIVCPRSVAANPLLQPFPNVFLHPSPWPLILQPIWILRKGKELISAHGHDTMTVHEYPPFFNGLGAMCLSKRTCIPYALEFHHGEPLRMSLRGRLERLWLRLFAAFDADCAVRVRVVNKAAGDTLVRWGVPREKIRVVSSLYIDLTVFRPDPSVTKRFDVAFMSRFVKGKGFPELIDVMGEIPHAILLAIGDGPELDHFQSMVRSKGLADRVTFTGWVSPPSELARTVQSARVFVMNSWSEGNPRSAIEAMACGIPVIATRVGVMPDVIEETESGMLISADRTALLRSLRSLLGDPGLQVRLSQRAPGAVSRFEKGKMMGEYAAFLRSFAKSSKVPDTLQ